MRKIKSVCIITPFYNSFLENSRPKFVRDCLARNNIHTSLITSDFNHTEKRKVSNNEEDTILIKTITYSKNTSLMRFISHFKLAVDLSLSGYNKRDEVDAYYVTAPFAIVALILKLVLRKPVIVDIVDFWPTSLPFRESSVTLPFLKIWEKLNKLSISRCDKVISTSSNFLKQVDSNYIENLIFLGCSPNFTEYDPISTDSLRIMYIGNVGILYDFDTLVKAISLSSCEISLDIVGGGDKLDYLTDLLDFYQVNYAYHGVIYDDGKLAEIAKRCVFGFNGFKNTNASFSYKAVSYFKFGLPIINSMSGDLFDIVESQNVGFNYTAGDAQGLVKILDSNMENYRTQNDVVRFFEGNLDKNTVSKKLLDKFLELK